VSRALALFSVLLLTPGVQAEQQLATYPGAVHTRIGNDLIIGGELYRMAYFTTADSLEQVARHFEKQWKAQGYPTVVEGDLRREAVISALYTREGLQRGIVLRRHEGKTLGFTVLRDLWEQAPVGGRPGLVKLEGSLFTSDVASRDTDGGSQQRTSLIEGDLEAVRKEVELKLGSAGFERTREGSQQVHGKPQLTLDFSAGAQQAVVSLTEVGPKLTAVVQLSVGSDRLDGSSNEEAVRKGRAEHEKAHEEGRP
jgi:hypothetical protein